MNDQFDNPCTPVSWVHDDFSVSPSHRQGDLYEGQPETICSDKFVLLRHDVQSLLLRSRRTKRQLRLFCIRFAKDIGSKRDRNKNTQEHVRVRARVYVYVCMHTNTYVQARVSMLYTSGTL